LTCAMVQTGYRYLQFMDRQRPSVLVGWNHVAGTGSIRRPHDRLANTVIGCKPDIR
jgi:hypothetical protein